MKDRLVLLVGHGGVPTDCPATYVADFKKLEAAVKRDPAQRAALLEADRRVREWPRTPKTDPYKTGLEAVGDALRKALPGREVRLAYNEFCAPSLEDALESAVRDGARDVTVITTMYTRGGVHSEKEMPVILEEFRRAHPGVTVRYCWPFDLEAVGGLLAREVRRAETEAAPR
jgi:sirohydrochlorin cobaltochelatase